MDIKTRFTKAKQAIYQAGKLIKNAPISYSETSKYGRLNFVTEIDIANHKIFKELLDKQFPGDILVSEENNIRFNKLGEMDKVWVLDPLDGTNNFRFQRRQSAVSVAYVEKGKTVFGIVYDSYADELFESMTGRGAYLNNQKIRISTSTDMLKTTVTTDNSYDPEITRRNLKLFLKIKPSPWILINGCAVLTGCGVACGRIDLFFQLEAKPWDYAAIFLMIEEAGGIIRNIKGGKTDFLQPDAVMGNENLVNQFVKLSKL